MSKNKLQIFPLKHGPLATFPIPADDSMLPVIQAENLGVNFDISVPHT